jgi:hypothetical protein
MQGHMSPEKTQYIVTDLLKASLGDKTAERVLAHAPRNNTVEAVTLRNAIT